MTNNYYVYRYVRLDTNTPFYVGNGNKPNYARANDLKNRSKLFKEILSTTEVRVEIILEDLNKEEAELKEAEFISLHKRTRDGGTLVNILKNGKLATNEQRLNLSNAQKIRLKDGCNNPMYGKTHSKETRLKISESQKGDKSHCFGKKGELSHNFGKKHSEETKNKMSKSHLARIFSEESKNKISEKKKEYWRLKKLSKQ
jgi:hypothetical protein